MYTRKENGITIISLVITIIVILILSSAAVTVSLNSNMLFKTKESAFKSELIKYKTDFQEYIETGGQYLTDDFEQESINAETLDEIIEYIPSFKDKYEGKFEIYAGQISYTNLLEEPEITWANELGIFQKIAITEEDFFEVNEYRNFNKSICRSKWRKNSSRG